MGSGERFVRGSVADDSEGAAPTCGTMVEAQFLSRFKSQQHHPETSDAGCEGNEAARFGVRAIQGPSSSGRSHGRSPEPGCDAQDSVGHVGERTTRHVQQSWQLSRRQRRRNVPFPSRSRTLNCSLVGSKSESKRLARTP